MNWRVIGIGILGIVLLAVGTPGIADRLIHGHANAGYGTPIPWAMWVVLYVYFIGLSAGSFLISSLIYVFGVKRFEAVGRMALFTALVCLMTSLLFIALDLGHTERAPLVLTRPSFSSPLAWIVWLYTIYFILLLAETWLAIRSSLVEGSNGKGLKAFLYGILTFGVRDLSEKSLLRDRNLLKILATIGVPLAIVFHGGVGSVFAVTIARAYWYTGLFPIMFLVSALASGGALLTTIAAFVMPNGLTKHKDLVIGLGQLLAMLLFADVLMEIAEILVSLYGTVPAHFIPIYDQLFGPNWYIFWIMGAGFALLLPLILLTTVGRRSALWTGLAALVSAVGFVGVRWNIIMPGFAVEELPGIGQAFFEPSWMYGPYVPTPMEWLVATFLIGLALVVFALGSWVLPLGAEPNVREHQAAFKAEAVE